MPEDLLLATGKLNSIAQSRLAEHAARGEEALAAIPEFEEMARWVRWHHERPDGQGLPGQAARSLDPAGGQDTRGGAGLRRDGAGPAPPPGHGAPRRRREKLSAGIDTEFDGVVVRALLRILETESEGYRMADDHRFVFPAPETKGGARTRTYPICAPKMASAGSSPDSTVRAPIERDETEDMRPTKIGTDGTASPRIGLFRVALAGCRRR